MALVYDDVDRQAAGGDGPELEFPLLDPTYVAFP